jgi:hypothetical protein
MTPNEIPGFDDLEPIHDGADLEPLHDGGDLEPLEPEIPEQLSELEPVLAVPEETGMPEILEPEPAEELAAEEPAAVEEVLVEEELSPEPAAEPVSGEAGADASLAVDRIATAAPAPADAQDKSVEGAAAGKAPRGSKAPAKKELERAPLMQLKASQYLFLACLLPWGDPTGDFAMGLGEKLICALGCWVAIQSQLGYGTGAGFMAGLTKGGPGKGVILGLLLSCVGLAPLVTGGFSGGLFLEKLSLIGAGFTWAHIVGYQHGGKFNPLYAFTFSIPLFGGIPSLLVAFAADANGFFKLLAIVGGLVALVASFQGVRALVLAMMEAKKEGEAKKKAAIEARRLARKAGKKVPPLKKG